MPLVFDVATKEPVAWTCDYCGELVHKPIDQFTHRMDCRAEARSVARVNARQRALPVVSVLEQMDVFVPLLRGIDRMSPERAAELACFLESEIEAQDWPHEAAAVLVTLEIELWALRRRAAGVKLFPWRKGRHAGSSAA